MALFRATKIFLYVHAVGFTETLNFFYERAQQRGWVQNQTDFADRHKFTRERMNQFLNGEMPPLKTIAAICHKEGYEVEDLIHLRNSQPRMRIMLPLLPNC